MSKTVLIVRNANAQDFGGGERYPIYLGDELNNNSLNPIVATAHKKIFDLAGSHHLRSVQVPWLKSQNISGIRIALFPFYLFWQLILATIYCVKIVQYKVDALHLQSRDDFISGTLAGKILGKNVIWTDHADLKYIFQNVNILYKNPVGKLVYLMSRYADKIIVVSKNEQDLINKSLAPRKLANSVLIYNGISDLKISPQRNFNKEVTVFALTSRLVNEKGLREIIDASKRLDEEGLKHRVLLIGEGSQEKALKKRAGKSVLFVGFPDNALSLVAGSDIFVHPSYNEAFSLSLVEAAMLGKPTIATNIGGNPEIIKHKVTGFLVLPEDTDSLYLAMKESIINPKEFERYGKALRHVYETSFQFDRIVKDQIIPLYNSK